MHQKGSIRALTIALDAALAHTQAWPGPEQRRGCEVPGAHTCTGVAKPVAEGPRAQLGTQRKRGRRQHGWRPAERPGLTAGALKRSNIRPLMKGLATVCVLAIPSLVAAAEDSAFIEEVVIVGSRTSNSQLAGSAYHIGQEQLKRLGHGDIQRIIRQVPGVSVQVEDGYGLRPNISIRGVATERSGRITLLEDNVLIAPAPYSAPSAYYFPTTGRMAAIEVLTGPAAIKQGPYTIGGALNMLSTPVPDEAAGQAMLEGGEDQSWRLHTHYGARNQAGFGFLAETHQWRSDGYQDVDRGGDAGLDLEDYTLKFSYAPPAAVHRVDLKLQHAKQESQQSYLGLTDADFAAAPFRRYGLSALDNIETNHKQLIARYQWTPTEAIDLSAHYYRNSHERDWFKTEGIDFDGSPNAGAFSRTSWANVVQAVNRRQPLGGFTPAQLQGVLDGALDTAPGSIQVRSNAREYLSQGVQAQLAWRLTTGNAQHQLSIGARRHKDDEDRLQRNSTYSQVGGALRLDDPGLLGNAGNRLQEAWATSVFIMDEITWGPWTFTPGLRYEDIEQKRTRWETRPGRTEDPASRAQGNLRSSRSNKTKVWLPGFGAIYNAGPQLSFFAGLHKGFTAPSNAPGVKEEKALNYEAGARYSGESLRAEATWFLSDYDNLLGECTASSGTDCAIGDAFNGEAATVQGLELRFAATLLPESRVSLPLELAYTHISGEFDTDIADTDFFGDVSKGDPIPYIPEHQLNLTLGAQHARWHLFLSANYVDAVCTRAACGPFQRTDSALVLDLAANYALARNLDLFARLENLSRSKDIMGRQPYGARPNKDRTASLGLRLTF